MNKTSTNNKIISDNTNLLTWVDAFLKDRKAQNLTKGTIKFYSIKLNIFCKYCLSQNITIIEEITSILIRDFMLDLENKNHAKGNIHCYYRSIKVFLRWWELENDLTDWDNPIRKVKPPRVAIEQLEPISLEVVKYLLDTCQNDILGLRDKSLFLTLLDTGCRAAEIISMDIKDFDIISGEILIRCGKNRKPRSVFVGQKTRKTIKQYLKYRNDNTPCLWLTKYGERITYGGLNEILRRRSKLAGIEKQELHSFRRAFAINFLRNGGDIFTLQKLGGWADLQIMRRYLAQTNQDIQEAHKRFSPVDNLF